MNFNTHSNLKGKHAFLSASKYHWIRYDEDKLAATFYKAMMSARGVALHDFGHHAITMGIRLAETENTLNMYVNDAIGFRLQSEQTLYYSDNCFGTADAIGFRDNFLRIHDLKTGETEASFDQLMVYGAIFCLEYRFNPFDIKTELRIYQNDAIDIVEPDPDDIMHVMDKIVTLDRLIETIKAEESA